MAVDTARKRASAIHLGLPWRTPHPVPDGTLDSFDWAFLAGFYAGLITSPIILNLPVVYADPGPLAIAQLRLQTDVLANGGQLLGLITNYWGLTESKGRSGEHTIEFSVPIDHPIVRLVSTPPDLPNLRVDQVVRMVKTDGSWSEHRIEEPSRQNQRGARSRRIVARSIYQDLGIRGMVSRTTADGSSTASFQALSLNMFRQADSYILPALVAAGQGFWRLVEVPHDSLVDMVYEAATPLAALLQLCEVGGRAAGTGALEMWVEASDDHYDIHIVSRVGAALPTVTVRAKRDLVDLGFSERAADQVTRVYAFGQADQDGQRPSVAEASWDVVRTSVPSSGRLDIVLADPAGGLGPLRFDGQFIFPFHLAYETGLDFVVPIESTFAATQTFRVATLATPPVQLPGEAPHRVRIVADDTSRRNLYVDHPAMVANYGVRVGELPQPDIPSTNNLIPNPFGRVWPDTSPLPTGWSVYQSDTAPPTVINITRETNPQLVEHAGQSIRVQIPAATSDHWIASPVARLPLRAQGYLGWFVKATTLSGSGFPVRVWAQITRRGTDYAGAVAPPFQFLGAGTSYTYLFPDQSGLLQDDAGPVPDVVSVEYDTAEDIGVAAFWDLSKYPLYGGTVQIFIGPAHGQAGDPSVAPIEFIVHAVQLTGTADIPPLMEGNGGVRLHQAANGKVGLYGSPAPVISVNLIDLAHAQGFGFPYAGLDIGAPVRIEDPRSDVEAVESRVVGWRRDWSNRTMPEVELSNERSDIATLLAGRSLPERHRVTLVPQSVRGRRFASL